MEKLCWPSSPPRGRREGDSVSSQRAAMGAARTNQLASLGLRRGSLLESVCLARSVCANADPRCEDREMGNRKMTAAQQPSEGEHDG